MTPDDGLTHDRLLPAARQLATRLGVVSLPVISGVELRQMGRMRSDREGAWSNFTATQVISTRDCAFEWRARSGLLSSMTISDALAGGAGSLAVRVFGLVPVARPPASAQLTRGELMRYLAELAWAPDAIVLNRTLRWREDGPDTLIVGAGEGDTAAEVVLGLDTAGRIGSIAAPDRPRSVGSGFVATPWFGVFSDYRLLDDRWLPFRGAVGWSLGGEQVVCWEGRIERWIARA